MLPPLAALLLLTGCYKKHQELPQPQEQEEPCAPPLPPPPPFGNTSVTVYPNRLAAVYNPRNAQEVVYVMDTLDVSVPNFVRNVRHLWVRNLQTGRERRLLTGIYTDQDWSRRDWIVTGRPDGQLYKIKSNGDSLTRLTNRYFNEFPAWSPDGQLLAYYRIVSNAPAQNGVVICRADGTFLRLIPDAQIRSFGPMAWSSDGRRLALVSSLHRPVDQPALCTYDLDQNTLTQLTPLAQHTYRVHMRWLPNGRDIVWADGSRGVQVTNEDTRQTRLVRAVCPGGTRSFGNVCPSPDGQRLLMTRGDASASTTTAEVFYRATWETTDLDGKHIQRISF